MEFGDRYLKVVFKNPVSAEKHQNRWLDFLPFVVLGRNSALQPDIGASPNELAFGSALRIPGQLLQDPGEVPDAEGLQMLLQDVKTRTARPAVQPSRHNPLEAPLPDIPSGVTHAYTRQHKTTGLQAPFEGPFRIASRPSRSTVQLEVGVYNNGEKRFEIRHLNDLRLAHPESLAAEASRPKLGRPSSRSNGQNTTDRQSLQPTRSNNFSTAPEPPVSLPSSKSKQAAGPAATVAMNPNINHETSTSDSRVPASARPVRTTRNPSPYYVDASQWSPKPWSASPGEIAALNAAIGS